MAPAQILAVKQERADVEAEKAREQSKKAPPKAPINLDEDEVSAKVAEKRLHGELGPVDAADGTVPPQKKPHSIIKALMSQKTGVPSELSSDQAKEIVPPKAAGKVDVPAEGKKKVAPTEATKKVAPKGEKEMVASSEATKKTAPDRGKKKKDAHEGAK